MRIRKIKSRTHSHGRQQCAETLLKAENLSRREHGTVWSFGSRIQLEYKGLLMATRIKYFLYH